MFVYVYYRLVHDIDTVVGSKAKIDYNDLGKMNYLDMVWKETLRLYPPSISTVRETEKDFVIDGIYIPGGTDINVSYDLLLEMKQRINN